jgi:uncharacterized membrane protein HdeD (DUF308 family)
MITDDMKAVYNRGKWALVVRGLFGIALGIFIIARPLDSVAAFALVIAIWALGDGIVTMVHAVDVRAVAPHWWVLMLKGLVSAVFGVAALYYYPGLSLTFVVMWTALWLFTAGGLGVYVASQERQAKLSWGWTMVFGLVAIGAGVLAVAYPGITLAGLISLIAAFGIVSGMALLVGAGKLQSFESDVNRAVRNPVRT